jgi:hypothetical protein
MSRALTNTQARQMISAGATPRDIIRLRWPHLTDSECDYILWERTAFPLIQGVHDLVDAICELPDHPTTPTTSPEQDESTEAQA